MSPVVLIIVAVVLALLVLWVAFAPRLFPLRVEPSVALRATAADGWELAVWHRPAVQRRFAEPVVLCHGLGNNHRVFDLDAPLSLSRALSEAGFDCYCVDLRGSGQSQRAPKGAAFHGCIDDYVQFDAPAVVELALKRSQSPRALWLGHSLGGLVGLSLPPEVQPKIAGLVTIGSPVFFAPLTARTRFSLRLGKFFSFPRRIHLDLLARLGLPFAAWAPRYFTEGMMNPANVDGRVRRLSLANIIAPIWHGVLAQMSDWVRNDVMRSADQRVDYRARIAALKVPLLTVGGAVDRLAPIETVTRAHALAGSADKALWVERPAGVSYGHGDLLFGRDAPVHIYPALIAWLSARATPLPQSDGAVLRAVPG